MRFLRRALMGLFLLGLTAGLLAVAGSVLRDALEARQAREGGGPPARERVFAAPVTTVTPETIAPTLASYGEIRARRRLEIRAPESGVIAELGPGVEEGGAVAAGDLLFRLDPAEAEAALRLAEADLADAEAALRDAGRDLELAGDDLAAAQAQAELRRRAFDRQQGLAERGIGTEAAVEQAELALSTAEQAVLARRQGEAQAEAARDRAKRALARARIALDEAGRRRAELEIRAGFGGLLSGVAVVPGGRVANGERLAELVDPSALEVAFRVSTAEYARLTGAEGTLPRTELTVTLEAAGLPISARARLDRESAVVGEGQTGRQLFATLAEGAGFRPGDFVTVTLEEPPLANVARLPATALDGSGTLLVLGPEDRLESVPATLLRRQGDSVIVAAGDIARREVVTRRGPQLGPGIKTRPQRDSGAAETSPAEPEMVELSEERRAQLVAFVEGNNRMPDEARQRVLAQLRQPRVPAAMVARIEARMGG